MLRTTPVLTWVSVATGGFATGDFVAGVAPTAAEALDRDYHHARWQLAVSPGSSLVSTAASANVGAMEGSL